MNNHSFVICAYKESEYLEECIKSVLAQTIKSDVIISTSTKNDFIIGIAQKYNIPVLVSTEESDISRDWNFAINNAKTEYVTIAHQDDIYEKEYTQNVLKMFEKNDDAIICCTDYYEIRNDEKVSKNGNLIIKRLLCIPLNIPFVRRTRIGKRIPLAFGNGICCPSVTYVKKKIVQPLFETGMSSNIDWQAWEKLSRLKGSFVYCHKLLMGHRIHEESTTTKIIDSHNRGDEDYYMFTKFWPKCIAKRLAKVYSKSEKSNEV